MIEMARHSYTSAMDWMALPVGELICFWQALVNVLEKENEARREARDD